MCVCMCVSISAEIRAVSTHQSSNTACWRDHRHLLTLRSTQKGPDVRLRNTVRHRRQVTLYVDN